MIRLAEIQVIDVDPLYVLEGSVRKIGDRVRITAQLIEAATGNHIWAERYDRNLENIFIRYIGVFLDFRLNILLF